MPSTSLGIIASRLAHEIGTMLVLTTLYKAIVVSGIWPKIVSAWQSWPSFGLTMVGTFVVHEVMYLGRFLVQLQMIVALFDSKRVCNRD